MTSAVYSIRNIKTGRIYIGSSSNAEKRWGDHKGLLMRGRHHSIILQRSWNKHGPEVFAFEIVEVVEVAFLLEREQHWMAKGCGFNILPTAGSHRGAKRGPEARARMSAARKGKKIKPRTPEQCAAISLRQIGRLLTPQQKAKISAAQIGKPRGPHSSATRAKLREAGGGGQSLK